MAVLKTEEYSVKLSWVVKASDVEQEDAKLSGDELAAIEEAVSAIIAEQYPNIVVEVGKV